MGPGKTEFLPQAAADAELMDPAVAKQVMAAADDTGMAQPCPQIIVPKIGVGIEMDDMEVRILFQGRPERSQGDKVFPAQEEGQLAVGKDGCGPFLDGRKSCLGTAEAQFQIAAVKDGRILQVPVLIGAVRFQSETLMTDGRRAETGPGTETRRGIKGGAEQDDAGFVIRRITGQKSFHIGCQGHFSTSFSISSRKAGSQKDPTWSRVV